MGDFLLAAAFSGSLSCLSLSSAWKVRIQLVQEGSTVCTEMWCNFSEFVNFKARGIWYEPLDEQFAQHEPQSLTQGPVHFFGNSCSSVEWRSHCYA